MRILVTGAAGFVGSNLCETLLRSGHTVCGLDNLEPYYDTRLKRQNVELIGAAGARFEQVDIRDRASLGQLVDGFAPDAIAHLAAKAGVRNSLKFPREYFETNLMGTQNLLDACRDADVPHVVMASTSSVYAGVTAMPFSEAEPAIEPTQPYAVSKRSAELTLGMYHRTFGITATVTRLFTVYGPRGRPDMMPYKLAASIRDKTPVPRFEGDLRRDWTHVRDICRGIEAALESPQGFEVVNLGRGAPESLDMFIETLTEVAGAAPVLDVVDRPSTEMLETWADTTKCERLYGVTPEISVREGVADFWEWFVASEW